MSKPKIQPVPKRADLWSQFQRLAPQLFDGDGNLQQPPPVQDVLNLIARADSDRGNEALQYGVYRIAHREGDSFSPADSALIRQAVERLGIEPYATAKSAPPTPTRWRPVGEAAVVPSGPTILFEQPGGETMTRNEIVELKLAVTSSGDILVWEIQLNRVTDLASLKRFVSRCWGSAGRQNWLNGKRLFVQFSGKGIINADPELVQTVLANALPTAKEVILALPPQPAEALPASPAPSGEVRRLLAELLALPATRGSGLSRQTAQEIRRIRGLWTLFYASLDAPEIPVWVWRRQSRILASRMVRHLPPASRSREIISALASALYEELVTARREESAKALAPLPDRTDWSEETLAALRPKATELIADVRPKPSLSKISAQRTATAAQIERVWNHFYDSLENTAVPKELWQELAQRFAKKIAVNIPQKRLAGEIMFLLAAADVVYKEAEQTFRESAYKGKALAKALSALSAEEIIELSGRYKSSLLHVAFSLEDPIKKAEQFDQNRQRAEAYLREHGFGRIAKRTSLQFYVFAVDSAEMAEVRALELARTRQAGKLKAERVDTEPAEVGKADGDQPSAEAAWEEIKFRPPPSSPEELLAQLFEHRTRGVFKSETDSIGKIFRGYYAGLDKPEISEAAWTRLTDRFLRRVASYRRRVDVSDKLVGDLAQRLYEDFVVAKRELGLDETLLAEALGKWTLLELHELAAYLAPERLRVAVTKERPEALIQLRIRKVDRQRGSSTEPTHQPSLNLDPTQPPEESARQIIAAVRACEDRKGFISQQAKPFYDRMLSLWNKYYSEVTDPSVPKELWLQTGKTFGHLATHLIGHLEVSDLILKQVAHTIYGEIAQVLAELKGQGQKKAIAYGVTKLEATQIIGLYRIFPGTLVANIITHTDAKGEMARRLGYHQSAREYVEGLGLKDIPPRVIGIACAQPTVETVLREATRLAKEFVFERDFWMQRGFSKEVACAKAETRVRVLPSVSSKKKGGNGPKDGGAPPPAAPAGGGGVSKVVEGDSSRSALRMTEAPALRMTPRFGRAFERVGGIATVGGALSVVSVLKDTGQLSEQQSQMVHNGMLAGMVAVDGGFIVSLAAGTPAAYFGHQGATKLAKKIGIENPIATNLFGLWGGLLGFEAGEWALRHSRSYNEWRSASAVSTRQLAGSVSSAIGKMGFAVEKSLAQARHNISTGLRNYGKEVVAGFSMLGESLATGGLILAKVASCFVTPIFTINGLDTWGNKIPEDTI